MSLFEVMYGVLPRMDPGTGTGTSLVVPSSDVHRRLELLAGSVPRAIAQELQQRRGSLLHPLTSSGRGKGARGPRYRFREIACIRIKVLRTVQDPRSAPPSIRVRVTSRQDIKEGYSCW